LADAKIIGRCKDDTSLIMKRGKAYKRRGVSVVDPNSTRDCLAGAYHRNHHGDHTYNM
jgi:hypothetical protein